MKELIDARFVRAARRWLWGASTACLLLPMLRPFLASRTLYLLPMIHCFLFWAILMFKMRRAMSAGMRIRFAILTGESGDDIDEAAREHADSIRPAYILMFWPFLLILLGWLALTITSPAG